MSEPQSSGKLAKDKVCERRKQLILCGVFQCHLVFGGIASEGVSNSGVISFPEAGTGALRLSAKPLEPKLLSSITKCQLPY